MDLRTLRKIQTIVRNRRTLLDDLERRQRQSVVDRPDAQWLGWSRDARLASVRAEYEYWRRLLSELQGP